MSTSPKIAIIGAGPAGCTVGRLLHLAKIPFVIFEAEASSSIRSQGSTLDLHTGTGLAAMKECQLWDEFKKCARYDGEAMIIADKHFRKLFEEEGNTEENSSGRPEIDRTQLRQILVDSLPKECIKWNHRLRRLNDDGSLHFDHGVESGFVLVIGADGAWSKVRSQLTDVKPYYTGLGGIGLTITDPATRFPDLYKQCNRGSIFAFGDGKGLQPQQLGDGSIHMYTWSKRPENWMETCGFDPRDRKAAQKHLAQVFADWDPRLRKFTQVHDSTPTEPRNLYMLPLGNRFDHRTGFTIIGDAAHLMTPFAGEGVNLALRDAMDLAKAIVEGQSGGLDEKIEAFEEGMFVRANATQEETRRNMDGFFREGEGGIEMTIIAMLKDAPPEMRAAVRAKMEVGASEETKRLLASSD